MCKLFAILQFPIEIFSATPIDRNSSLTKFHIRPVEMVKKSYKEWTGRKPKKSSGTDITFDAVLVIVCYYKSVIRQGREKATVSFPTWLMFSLFIVYCSIFLVTKMKSAYYYVG